MLKHALYIFGIQKNQVNNNQIDSRQFAQLCKSYLRESSGKLIKIGIRLRSGTGQALGLQLGFAFEFSVFLISIIPNYIISTKLFMCLQLRTT